MQATKSTLQSCNAGYFIIALVFFQIIIIIVTRMQYRQDDGAKKRKVWNAKSFQEVRIKDIKKEGFYNSVAMLLLALFDSMAW